MTSPLGPFPTETAAQAARRDRSLEAATALLPHRGEVARYTGPTAALPPALRHLAAVTGTLLAVSRTISGTAVLDVDRGNGRTTRLTVSALDVELAR